MWVTNVLGSRRRSERNKPPSVRNVTDNVKDKVFFVFFFPKTKQNIRKQNIDKKTKINQTPFDFGAFSRRRHIGRRLWLRLHPHFGLTVFLSLNRNEVELLPYQVQ